MVTVPSVEAEDRRHLHRELEVLIDERTERSNRIRGLLATQGVRLELRLPRSSRPPTIHVRRE